jgi:hypothetical protein
MSRNLYLGADIIKLASAPDVAAEKRNVATLYKTVRHTDFPRPRARARDRPPAARRGRAAGSRPLRPHRPGRAGPERPRTAAAVRLARPAPPPARAPPPPLPRRLDRVVIRPAAKVLRTAVVGNRARDRIGGLRPSDHAGVVVKLRLK